MTGETTLSSMGTSRPQGVCSSGCLSIGGLWEGVLGNGFNLHVLLSLPSEIEAIKLAERKLKEERRRKAMVVVGDLHPLRDALPELQELEASRQQQTRR